MEAALFAQPLKFYCRYPVEELTWEMNWARTTVTADRDRPLPTKIEEHVKILLNFYIEMEFIILEHTNSVCQSEIIHNLLVIMKHPNLTNFNPKR